VQREELTGSPERLFSNSFLEYLRLLERLQHLLPFLEDADSEAGDFAPGHYGHKGFLECEGKELLLPVVGAAEAVALREEDDVLLVVDVWLALVEADLAIEDEVEALRLLLALVDEGLLPELGEEHGAADVVDGGEVLDALDGFDVEEDAGERIDIGHCTLLGLAHQDLEDESQIVLLDVVQVQTVEPDLLLAEDRLHRNYTSNYILIAHRMQEGWRIVLSELFKHMMNSFGY
jgi:hypothetical protein